MFILRKKQLELIFICLFISFSFYLSTENINKKTFDIKQVSSLPVDEKVIIIDAGHRTVKMVVL